LKREERKELQMYRYRLFKLIFNSSLWNSFFPTLWLVTHLKAF
jgi:hypothetical protein